MPPIQISDPVKDVAKINSAFQQLDALYTRLAAAEKQINYVQTTSQQHQQLAEITGTNNLTFTWTGATGTISWAAGSVLNRQGNYVPIPAGSITGLAATTTYWLAWNSVHSVMSYSTNLNTIQPNKNNLVICNVTTLGAGASGTIGGGGTEPGGQGFNRTIYATVGSGSGVSSLDGLTGPVVLHAGTGVGITDNSPVANDIDIKLADTAVTPGSYTNTNLTVDQQGRLTAAASGSSSGGSGGPGVPGVDGLDADEPMMIPGAQGPQGNPGATGPQGPIGLGLDGADADEPMMIPGVQGPQGNSGATGPLWFGAGIAAVLDPIAATVEPSSQSAIQTLKIGIPFTTGFNSAGYTVAKAGIYAKAADGTNPQVQFAVYTDSAGSPSSLVCNSAADVTIGTVPGWVFGNLSSTTLTSATQYWVVFQFKGSGSAIAQTTGTFAKFDTNTYGTWPASFGASSSGGLYSIVVALNLL